LGFIIGEDRGVSKVESSINFIMSDNDDEIAYLSCIGPLKAAELGRLDPWATDSGFCCFASGTALGALTVHGDFAFLHLWVAEVLEVGEEVAAGDGV
jgi:hypothetical protein